VRGTSAISALADYAKPELCCQEARLVLTHHRSLCVSDVAVGPRSHFCAIHAPVSMRQLRSLMEEKHMAQGTCIGPCFKESSERRMSWLSEAQDTRERWRKGGACTLRCFFGDWLTPESSLPAHT
jgi:hypothetical protein